MNGTTIYNGGQMTGVNTMINNLNKRINQAANATSYDEILSQIKGEISTEEKTPAEMTMDEYKIYFTEKLDEIPFCESRKKDVEIIHISDAAWERLKADPIYEQNILGNISRERSEYNSLLGVISLNSGECKVRYIEDTSEKCRTVSTEDGKIEMFGAELSTLGDFWSNGRKKFIKNLVNTQDKYLKQQILNKLLLKIGTGDKIQNTSNLASSVTSAMLYTNLY